MLGNTGMKPATGSVSNLKGTGYNAITLPNKTPQQMGLFNQGAEGLQQGFPEILKKLMEMSQGGNEDMWSKLEAPAMRQFGQLQGNIASRFSGLGLGARKSSGFQNALGDASTDLAERLQSNRMGLQQGAQDRLMQLYQSLMGQDLNTTALTPEPIPFWKQLALSLSGGLSEGAGKAAGAAMFA